MGDTPQTGSPPLGRPSVPLEQVVQRYHEKFNDSHLNNLAEELKIDNPSEFLNNFKKIAFMIGGLSNLTDISIHYRLDFEHDYPEQESDEDEHVDKGDMSLDPEYDGQADVATKRPRQEVLKLYDTKDGESTEQRPPTAMMVNPVVQNTPHFRSEFCATLMKRMGMGPPVVGRLKPRELAQLVQKRTDGKHINIPKLQVELYEEFEHAIQHALRNNTSKPDVKFNLIKKLFVKIQRCIRNFYITATPNEPGYKFFPVDYETYMRSTNHYFDFFRRCFKLAQELRKNGTSDETIKEVVQFLCSSVFIRLKNTQINAVEQFISELLSIADMVNAPGLTDEERKTRIIENLRPVIERIGRNKLDSIDPLNNAFFSYIKNDYAEYIWLQGLILGEVIVSKEEFYSKKSKGGGIRKKVNHTNKSRKSRRNKQKSKRNKQSRRNRQRT